MAIEKLNLDPLAGNFSRSFITNPAGHDGQRGASLFDDTIDEEDLWTITLNNYASGLTILIPWYMLSAISGNIEIKADVMKIESGDSAKVETASFDTSNDTGAVAVPGTTEFPIFTTLVLANDDSPSGAVVTFIIRIKRNTSVVSNASGDMAIGPGPILCTYTTT